MDTSLPLLAHAMLIAVAMLSLAGLSAWYGWLSLRRAATAAGRSGPRTGAGADIARLRDRIRRLEAIASGLEA